MQNKIELTDKQNPRQTRGQFWFNREDEELYILTLNNQKFHLVCLNDGFHWADPASTVDEAFDGQEHKFTLVTSPFTVTPDTE